MCRTVVCLLFQFYRSMNKNLIKVVLDDNKIKKLLKIKDVIKVIEEGFYKKGKGLVSLPPKIGPKLPQKNSFADAMSVSILESGVNKPRLRTYGIKWLSSFNENLKRNLPVLNSIIILNDLQTGLPIAILKGNYITAIRTCGVSAVCAKYLAPRKKEITVGIFGLGLQAYVHVLAFKIIFKRPKFFLFNHGDNFLKPFLKKFREEQFLVSKNFHDVVKNSDIILSATTFPPKISPYIFASDLKDDVLILPLDYGTRVSPSLYKHLNEIYTDDIPQYKSKSKLRNYFPKSRPEIKKEVGELVAKNYKRGKEPKRILVFNLGIALFDILCAELFLKKLS